MTTHVPQLKVDQLLGRLLLLEEMAKQMEDRLSDACCSEFKESVYSRKQITHQLDSPDFSQIKIIKSEKQSGQGFTGLRTFSGNILTPLKGNSLSKCIQLFFNIYPHSFSYSFPL